MQPHWIVKLNNDETRIEGVDYKVKFGELSPWKQMQKDIKLQGLTIVSIGFLVGEQKIWINDFLDGQESIKYRYFKTVSFDLMAKKTKVQERNSCIEAIIDKNIKFCLMIDDDSSNISINIIRDE
jgi:hypothetical protein